MPIRQPSSIKIRADHLDRQAFIYVRQSTMIQVRENTGSTCRQYDLTARAINLGWPKERIQIIDQDQGHSGASATNRDGFQFLVAEVGLKHAGAVFCLEASRLARSCSDWYRLLEICALTDTLVIDEEGIYDPGFYNDRLLLGFKGTMSEAELHWLRQRLLGGKIAKAEQGQLRFCLPTGLVYNPVGKIVLDPDEQVQGAVRMLFDLFSHYGSALAVVTHFAKNNLRFPTRLRSGGRVGELVWNRLTGGRVLTILHNPHYAGAYVFGRTHNRTQLLPGEPPRIKGRTRKVKFEDWPIVLLDSHQGYISWEQFRRNQQQLDDNRTWRSEDRRGVAREDAALLQGIVICGRCGRRMSAEYHNNRSTPFYVCNQAHSQLAARTCQTMSADNIDKAVANSFLAAVEPAQLEVSLAALEHIDARIRQVERQWQLRKERSQYEVDLARRRYIAVDPENRLVARSLEKEWNEKLAALEALDRESQVLPMHTIQIASPEQRKHVLDLAQDLPAIWHAETTANNERKQLLRFLIKDVTLTKVDKVISIAIRWQTGALTKFEIARAAKSWEVRKTDTKIVELIRQLAPDHTDQQIALLLNEAELSAGLGGTFTQSKVSWIRYTNGISTACPERPADCPTGQRADGRYSAATAAKLLNVDVCTISEWCKTGILDGVSAKPHGPRWIKLTPEIISKLRRPVKRRHHLRNIQPIVK